MKTMTMKWRQRLSDVNKYGRCYNSREICRLPRLKSKVIDIQSVSCELDSLHMINSPNPCKSLTVCL